MAIKPNFQEMKADSKFELKAQSAVECKLSLGADGVRIIAVNKNADLTGAETLDGELRYSGKLAYNLIYIDADGETGRSECSCEFSHKVTDEGIKPSMKASIRFNVENVEVKEVNGYYVISSIVGASITLCGELSYLYLSDGENIVCEKETSHAYRTIRCAPSVYPIEEEFYIDGLKDVLLHPEKAVLTAVQSGVGSVICDGEININLIYSDNAGNVKLFAKQIPFRMELPCEEAVPSSSAYAEVSVKSSKLSAEVDESNGTCALTAQIMLELQGEIYCESEFASVADAYSLDHELSCTTESLSFPKVSYSRLFTEKLSGDAIVGGKIDFSSDIEGVTLENVNASVTEVGNGYFYAEGVVSSTLIIKTAEGQRGGINIELPFSVKFESEEVKENSLIKISSYACNVTAKQKKESMIEMDCTLKLFAFVYDYEYSAIITSISEGEELIRNDKAISVYVPSKGDTLWTVSKELKELPEAIMTLNPELSFPLNGDERIVVYRQRKIDY